MAAALLALGTLSPLVAQAQEALYGPQPPKGSAYVRVVNLLDAPAKVTPDFRQPLNLGKSASDRVSSYEVVEKVDGRALKISVAAGGKTADAVVKADADGFLTIVIYPTAAGVKVAGVADLSEFNQNRSRLSFYNGVPGCDDAQVTLDPGGQAIFADVPTGETKARAVNPVSAMVRGACGGKPTEAVSLSGLEPGGMKSLFLLVDGGHPALLITPDVVTPYHK